MHEPYNISMGRFLRGGVLFTLLAGCSVSAWAIDPLLMFLLNAASEAAMRTLERNAALAPPPPPEPSRNYPGTNVEPAHLKQLIDDCFLYLQEGQKREIFAKLNAALLEPKNAAVRAPMIEHFTERALQVRAAQLHLARLSDGEKRRLANEFRKEVATLPLDELDRLAGLLRQGLLPVPPDFNQLLLAALAAPQ